jgi:hypothetical protein
VGNLTQPISDPKISSWNVGLHGFRGGREEIFALFEKGDPIICLQGLRIPENKVDVVKSELHALFPHYWIYISMAIINVAANQDERGRHYKFTTLTVLNSHYFPSATHLSLHPGSSKAQKGEELAIRQLQAGCSPSPPRLEMWQPSHHQSLPIHRK